MNQSIQAKRKDGELVKLTLKRLTFEDIDQIMALQDEIVEGLEDQQLYVPSDREEIQSHFGTEGVLLGYVTEENELAALAIYLKRGYSPSNYGYDVGLEGEELLKVGQVDTVLVKADYRGNNLQYRMCSLLEEIAKEFKGKMTIFVDGGIRSGADVFKSLALGADAAVIARPFVTAVFGGGYEGVRSYIQKIGAELIDAMEMCGVSTLEEITSDCIWRL